MTIENYLESDLETNYNFNVAVIMSVYKKDDPQKLESSLNSIFNQRKICLTKILVYLGVDGEIGHDLQNVIKKYASKIYKLKFFSQNRGLVFVLNDLIRILESEQFVFRMDADDVSHPLRFHKQISAMLSRPNVDVLGTAMREIYSDAGTKVVHFARSHDEAVKYIYWRVPVSHPTVCFRRHVLDVVGGYPQVPMNEDVAMWFECIAKGFRFDNLPEPLLDFTINNNFWKRRDSRKAFGEFNVYVRGIWKLEGVTWKLAIPIVRLAFRFMPEKIRRIGYASKLRRRTSL